MALFFNRSTERVWLSFHNFHVGGDYEVYAEPNAVVDLPDWIPDYIAEGKYAFLQRFKPHEIQEERLELVEAKTKPAKKPKKK